MFPDRRAFSASLCVLIAALATGQVACATPEPAPRRLVAIGDVHGSYVGLTGILQTAGLTDTNHQWIGGTTTFVHTGDVFDRGPGVRQSFDLLMRLQGEAARAGGLLQPLMGNHEVVNIVGDFRDVSPETFTQFADEQSEMRRTLAYENLAAVAKRRGRTADLPARDVWMAAHPPGYIEYTEAVGPRGVYGRWIRSHKVVATFDGTAYMHAGINHTFQGTLDDVNRMVIDEITAWDANKEAMVQAELIPPYATLAETVAAATAELTRLTGPGAQATANPPATSAFIDQLKRVAAIEQSPLLDMEGPMWFRGFALWKETDEAPFMALIGRLGINRFVAGHTPMPTHRIMNRWDFRIFQIDTGMLGGDFFKGGRASALEVVGKRLTAIYPDSREVVVDDDGKAPAKESLVP